MQTIFEIFDSVDGRTQGYREGEDIALQTCERAGRYGHTSLDYLPARDGFYVVDMRGFVRGHAYADRDLAERNANMENMATDTNAYHVTEHRL